MPSKIITAEEISSVLSEAIFSNLMHSQNEISLSISEDPLKSVDKDRALAFFYDLDLYQQNIAELFSSFEKYSCQTNGVKFLHAAAMKANAVKGILKIQRDLGCGAECASFGEVKIALDCGFPVDKIVFDSPCKTVAEIVAALRLGVHINLDNKQEIDIVEKVLQQCDAKGFKSKSCIGIRINPLVGAGKIAAQSVSTSKSKFGSPLPAEGKIREELVDLIASKTFITAAHVHTGSGGYGLQQLTDGVRIAVDFVKAVNSVRKSKNIATTIDVLDIGGGLAVNYASDEITPTFEEYTSLLHQNVPEVFDGKCFKTIITEFGASLNCKTAWLASRVEYTKTYDNHNVALFHAGSDLFVRACYDPDHFSKFRYHAYNKNGQLKTNDTTSKYDLAGPLCFAGDVIVKDVELPRLSPNDFVVIRDCGANTLSIKSMHCSRPFPLVLGYKKAHISTKSKYEFIELLPQQSLAELSQLWGK